MNRVLEQLPLALCEGVPAVTEDKHTAFTVSSDSGLSSISSKSCSPRILPTQPSLDGLVKFSSPRGKKSPFSVRTPKQKSQEESNAAHLQRISREDRTTVKLKMDSIGLVGRRDEIKHLKLCLHRMINARKSCISDSIRSLKSNDSFTVEPPSKELIFIKGYSGVGKTTLAESMKAYVAQTRNGIFVKGKFDFGNRVPFAEIANIFRQVCSRILDEESCVSKVGDAICDEIGGQLDMLIDLIPLIPELKELLVDHIGDVNQNNSMVSRSFDIYDVEYQQHRWKNSFRALCRVLSALVYPLVIMVDDMQWADIASIDLVNDLISDEENPNNFMIIACYRSNEIPPNSSLAHGIDSMIGRKEKFRYSVTDIEVGSFSMDDVKQMLMAMMSIDEEETVEELAKICCKRTLGNAYFFKELMTMLHREEFLTFNLATLKWTWNETDIEERTMSTFSVVDLLEARIGQLSKVAQSFLECVACLGSSFRLSTITIIWKEYCKKDANNIEAKELISTLSDQYFIERSGEDENKYQWVHEKIQEVAQHFIAEGDKAFRQDIGKILLNSLNEEQLEDQLFKVVDLINQGDVTNSTEFAKLNLRAANMARRISAFQIAANYTAHGIQLLPDDKWNVCRDLTVDLYTMGALMELTLGNGTTFDDYSKAVVERKDCQVTETMPLQIARVRKLSTVETNFKEAIDYSLVTLQEWGFNVSWKRFIKLQAKRKLKQTIKMIKDALSPDDILGALGIMKDPTLLAGMQLLSHLGYASYNCKHIFLKVLVTCKIVEMTLKHGVNVSSAPAFAALGMMAIVFHQDVETGNQSAQIALAMQEKTNPSSEAETIFIANCFCLPWTQPLESTLVPFVEAYLSGKQVGRNDYATWALLCHHVMVPFMMGKNLGALIDESTEILAQVEDVSQPVQESVLKIFLQGMHNLSTSLHDVERKRIGLEGNIITAEGSQGTETLTLAFIHLMQGELLLFSDLEKAADRAVQFGDKFVKHCPAGFLGMLETFHRAIALYAMARRTRQRKYRTRAEALRKRIRKWLDQGNPNVKHYSIFLNAEQAAMEKRDATARTNYRRAIVFAAHAGHLHHAALFNERYAEFLRIVIGDEYEARHRMNEAIRFYREWGAYGKAFELSKEL